MIRQPILANISKFKGIIAKGWMPHRSFDRAEEDLTIQRMVNFIEANSDCFERHASAGHITGSALVTNFDYSKVLLTLHSKLNIWLQLGGHADGEGHIEQVALREAFEEAGLTRLGLANIELWAKKQGDDAAVAGTTWIPFDLDVHLIPARKSEAAHFHYDVRYLVVVDCALPIVLSDESHDLRWMPLAEARSLTKERSMQRQFDKLDYLAPFARRGELLVKEYVMS